MPVFLRIYVFCRWGRVKLTILCVETISPEVRSYQWIVAQKCLMAVPVVGLNRFSLLLCHAHRCGILRLKHWMELLFQLHHVGLGYCLAQAVLRSPRLPSLSTPALWKSNVLPCQRASDTTSPVYRLLWVVVPCRLSDLDANFALIRKPRTLPYIGGISGRSRFPRPSERAKGSIIFEWRMIP